MEKRREMGGEASLRRGRQGEGGRGEEGRVRGRDLCEEHGGAGGRVDTGTQGMWFPPRRKNRHVVMLECQGPACRVGPVPGLAREVVEELETESNRCY